MPKVPVARFFSSRSKLNTNRLSIPTSEYTKLFPLSSSKAVIPIRYGGHEFSPAMVAKSSVHLDKFDVTATAIKNNRDISPLHKQLAQSKKLHGENNIHTVPMISQLGEAYLRQTNIPEAKKCFTEALNIIDQELKKTASEPVLFQAAEAYRYLGLTSLTNYEIDAAIKFYSRSLEIRKMLDRELHVANVGIFFDLAMVHMTENNFLKASEYYKKLIEINNKVIARDVSHWEENLTCLGTLELLAGEFTKALEYQHKSLKYLRLPPPGKKPDKFITEQLNVGTAVELNNLGCTLVAMGNREEAHAKFDESANIITSFYGDAHPLLKVSQKNSNLLEKTCNPSALM